MIKFKVSLGYTAGFFLSKNKTNKTRWTQKLSLILKCIKIFSCFPAPAFNLLDTRITGMHLMSPHPPPEAFFFSFLLDSSGAETWVWAHWASVLSLLLSYTVPASTFIL